MRLILEISADKTKGQEFRTEAAIAEAIFALFPAILDVEGSEHVIYDGHLVPSYQPSTRKGPSHG